MMGAAFLVLGGAAGAAFFGSLRWASAQVIASAVDGRRWARLALVQAGRILLLVGLLAWSAHQGARPLLLAAAGLLGARQAWLAGVRRHGTRSR